MKEFAEEFLEKEGIEDFIVGLDSCGEFIFATDLISMAIEQQLELRGLLKEETALINPCKCPHRVSGFCTA